jgi:hypothetical protein
MFKVRRPTDRIYYGNIYEQVCSILNGIMFVKGIDALIDW